MEVIENKSKFEICDLITVDDQNITEEVKIKSFEELRDKMTKIFRDITRQQIKAERRSISKGKKRYYKEFLRQTKDNPIGHKTIKSLFSSNLDRETEILDKMIAEDRKPKKGRNQNTLNILKVLILRL